MQPTNEKKQLPPEVEKAFVKRFIATVPFTDWREEPRINEMVDFIAQALETEVQRAVEKRDGEWIETIEKKWDEVGMEELMNFHFSQVVESLSPKKEA